MIANPTKNWIGFVSHLQQRETPGHPFVLYAAAMRYNFIVHVISVLTLEEYVLYPDQRPTSESQYQHVYLAHMQQKHYVSLIKIKGNCYLCLTTHRDSFEGDLFLRLYFRKVTMLSNKSPIQDPGFSYVGSLYTFVTSIDHTFRSCGNVLQIVNVETKWLHTALFKTKSPKKLLNVQKTNSIEFIFGSRKSDSYISVSVYEQL